MIATSRAIAESLRTVPGLRVQQRGGPGSLTTVKPVVCETKTPHKLAQAMVTLHPLLLLYIVSDELDRQLSLQVPVALNGTGE
jgi:hypothetical protein